MRNIREGNILSLMSSMSFASLIYKLNGFKCLSHYLFCRFVVIKSKLIQIALILKRLMEVALGEIFYFVVKLALCRYLFWGNIKYSNLNLKLSLSFKNFVAEQVFIL